MITTITGISLLLLIILQIIVSIHMLITNHQQCKKDKAFYEQLCKNLEEQQNVFLEITKEGDQCEPPEEVRSEK